MKGYLEVLRIKPVKYSVIFAIICRAPLFSLAVVLTLHLVTDLGKDYASAGLVTAGVTLASMIAAPWRGHILGRLGVRRTMLPSLIILTTMWLIAPFISYYQLLVFLPLACLWGYPLFTLPRQVMVANTAPEQRKMAIAIDAISVEICYMIGPMFGIIAATMVGTTITLIGSALISALGALGYMLLNPTISGQDENAAFSDQNDIGAQSWLSWPVFGILICVLAGGISVSGSEIATVAAMNTLQMPSAIGWAFAAAGFGSAFGGLIYGAASFRISSPLLLIAVCIGTALPAVGQNSLEVAGLMWFCGLFYAPFVTTTVEALSNKVVPKYRGMVLGLQGAALNAGVALASPLVGAVCDQYAWRWGFIAAGAVGVVVGLVVILVRMLRGTAKTYAKATFRFLWK